MPSSPSMTNYQKLTHGVPDTELLDHWRESEIVRIQIFEVLPHTLLFLTFHGFDHFTIDLQQPESGGDLIRADDKQIDPRFLGFHLCFFNAVVNVPLVQS